MSLGVKSESFLHLCTFVNDAKTTTRCGMCCCLNPITIIRLCVWMCICSMLLAHALYSHALFLPNANHSNYMSRTANVSEFNLMEGESPASGMHVMFNLKGGQLNALNLVPLICRTMAWTYFLFKIWGH